MTKKDPVKKTGRDAQARDDRLKAALKANLARRKAQMRARADDRAGEDAGKTRNED